MRKILVMIPAGEVYDHDCVRWYRHRDVQRSINHYHNIGDAFVHDSSLKLLDFDVVNAFEISSMNEAAIEEYNAEYSYVFLRGSNYINPAATWRHALANLSKLKIPVLAFGVGAQTAKDSPIALSEETIQVLRTLSERSVSIGVRGAYTADLLWRLGIRNTRIIGCPTMFRHRNPELRVELPPLETVRRLGFTLRREVGKSYARDIRRYLTVLRETLIGLSARFETTVISQGEIEEKKIALGTEEQRIDAFVELARQQWFRNRGDSLIELYNKRLFYSDVVADYDAIVLQQDLVLGFRLHGNLISLANGVPTIYFTYDQRTFELVRTFDIPSYDVFSGTDFVLEKYWDQSLFDRFNRTYQQRYADMRAFLDENGIAHRMSSVAPKQQDMKHVA